MSEHISNDVYIHWASLDPAPIQFVPANGSYLIHDDDTAVWSLAPRLLMLIEPDGAVDLRGRTADEAARDFVRSILRAPETWVDSQPDGALVVSLSGRRLVVLFRDGSYDALDGYQPDEEARAFWAHVSKLYRTLPAWLWETDDD